MKRLTYILALLLLLPAPSQAQMLEAIVGGGSVAPVPVTLVPLGMYNQVANGGTNLYFGAFNVNTTKSSADIGSPIGGTITGMYVTSDLAAGAGTTVVHLYVGASDAANCTIANAAFSCSATGLSVALNRGDLIAGKIITNSAAAYTQFGMYLRVSGDSGTTLLFNTSVGIAAAGRQFFIPGTVQTSEASASLASPVGGTVTELYVNSNVVSAGAGSPVNFNVLTSPQATCTIASGAKSCTATGLTGSVAPGNVVDGNATNNGATTTVYGILARIEGAGAVALQMFGARTIANASTGYISLPSESATEANVEAGSPISGTVTAIYARSFANATGTGSVITLNIAGSPSAVTCTIASGAQACSATGFTTALTTGQGISTKVVSTATTNYAVWYRVEGAN